MVTAVQRLDLLGVRVERRHRRLLRLPGSVVPPVVTELTEDPARRLADLLRRVLPPAGEPRPPAERGRRPASGTPWTGPAAERGRSTGVAGAPAPSTGAEVEPAEAGRVEIRRAGTAPGVPSMPREAPESRPVREVGAAGGTADEASSAAGHGPEQPHRTPAARPAPTANGRIRVPPDRPANGDRPGDRVRPAAGGRPDDEDRPDADWPGDERGAGYGRRSVERGRGSPEEGRAGGAPETAEPAGEAGERPMRLALGMTEMAAVLRRDIERAPGVPEERGTRPVAATTASLDPQNLVRVIAEELEIEILRHYGEPGR